MTPKERTLLLTVARIQRRRLVFGVNGHEQEDLAALDTALAPFDAGAPIFATMDLSVSGDEGKGHVGVINSNRKWHPYLKG